MIPVAAFVYLVFYVILFQYVVDSIALSKILAWHGKRRVAIVKRGIPSVLHRAA